MIFGNSVTNARKITLEIPLKTLSKDQTFVPDREVGDSDENY